MEDNVQSVLQGGDEGESHVPRMQMPISFFFCCLIEFMEKAPAVVREGIITKCVSLHSSAAFTGSSSVQWLYKYWGLLV